MAISALLGVCLGTRAGASTPEGAMMLPGRACVVRGSRDRLNYLVIDGQLQKRSRYYIFLSWAETPEGRWYLHKQDRAGASTPEGAMMLPGRADHVFGGQTWLDVLSQMGGCPSEFVDSWNLVIDQRLKAAISPRLVCHDGASTPSS